MKSFQTSFMLVIIFITMWSINGQAQNRLRVTNNGASLGTTTPFTASTFQIHNPNNTSSRLYITNSSNASGTNGGLLLESIQTTAFVWNYDNGPMRIGTSNTDRIYLSSDGKVGIGTIEPISNLHLSTSSNGYFALSTGSLNPQVNNLENMGIYPHYVQGDYNGGNPTTIFEAPIKNGVRNDYLITWRNVATEGQIGMIIKGGTGNVGIGTLNPGSYKLNVNGSINATCINQVNPGTCSSDIRLKKDIQAIDQNTIAKLSQVRGTTYNWRTEEFKERGFKKTKQIGFIAQELIKVYPELVEKQPDGYYSVNYTGLIPVLVEAIKQQQKTIDGQQQKITDLETANAKIKAQLEKINSLEQRLKALETGDKTLNK